MNTNQDDQKEGGLNGRAEPASTDESEALSLSSGGGLRSRLPQVPAGDQITVSLSAVTAILQVMQQNTAELLAIINGVPSAAKLAKPYRNRLEALVAYLKATGRPVKKRDIPDILRYQGLPPHTRQTQYNWLSDRKAKEQLDLDGAWVRLKDSTTETTSKGTDKEGI